MLYEVITQPELANVEMLRGIMRAIEEKVTVLRLIEQVLEGTGVKVILSSEHHVAPGSQYALDQLRAPGRRRHQRDDRVV